jgi:hypothetical protein
MPSVPVADVVDGKPSRVIADGLRDPITRARRLDKDQAGLWQIFGLFPVFDAR